MLSIRHAAGALAVAALLFSTSAQAAEDEPEDLTMLGAGIALMPLGTVTAINGSFLWIFGAVQECECPVGADCDCGDSLAMAGIGVWAGGGGLLVTGIVLAAVGGQPKDEAGVPAIAVSPTGGSLTWSF